MRRKPILPPLLLLLALPMTLLWAQENNGNTVQIRTAYYEGREHFFIHTGGGDYYYDKSGGGFSRLLDPDGQDWIAFKKEPWDQYPASAASAYRGIPNLVFRSEDNGAGHPGHDQCSSVQVNDRAIRTVSHSGVWQWTWEFFDHYALLRVQKVDPDHPYWFLYEGVPGGRFEPARQYYGTDKGGPDSTQYDYFAGDRIYDHWRWAYFGHRDAKRILYLAQIQPDAQLGTFSYLGNSADGIRSADGMVVFGFGRAEGAKPLLKKTTNFILGFYESAITDLRAHRQFHRKLQRRLKKIQ